MSDGVTSKSSSGVGSAALIFLLLFSSPATAQVQNPPAANHSSAAEAAADRLMHRFYKTLEFSVIWNELAVSSPAVRKREVDLTLFGLLWNSEAKIPDADKEQTYVAQRNFNFLISALRYTAPDALDSSEFEAKFKGPYESMTQIKLPISSTSDLKVQVVAKLEKVNGILREYIKSEAYNSAAYLADVQKLDEDEPEDSARVREAFASVLSKDDRIYVARREFHYLYFIKEGDDFKLLTIRSRRRD